MKTIVPAKENLAKLWGHPKPKDTAYRRMKYLLRTEVEDGVLLHNVVTGQLVLLDEAEAMLLDNLPTPYTPEMDALIADHFIVPEAFDEHQSVLQLRSILRKLEAQQDKCITNYTILPTTCCNARCFYCYEAGYRQVSMSDSILQQTVEFIQQNSHEKKVHISWFGGEPLLGTNTINHLCTELKKRGIEYDSDAISNGSLFNADVIEQAKLLWHLTKVQITIDGTEEVYLRAKNYVNSDSDVYQRVMTNIQLLLNVGIKVNIRMNMDRYNYDNLLKLIDEIAEHFGKNDLLNVYAEALFDDFGYDPVQHTDDDHVWLEQKKDELHRIIVGKGLLVKREREVPSLRLNSCMADNDSTIVITPEGLLAKCTDSFEEMPVGALGSSMSSAVIEEWKKTKELPECGECPLYPHCINLLNCSSKVFCFEAKRKNRMDQYINVMRNSYYKNIRRNSDEGVC